MYSATNPASALYAPTPFRSTGDVQFAAVQLADSRSAVSRSAASSVYGQDAFVPSSAYAARATSPSSSGYPSTTAYSPGASYAYSSSYASSAPSYPLPDILRLEDIPGTPERMKHLTKQVMAPYFNSIAQTLYDDPEVSMAIRYGLYSDEQKLRLVERVKAIVSDLYNLPPIATQLLDEPWVGGGYSFDQNYLYSITTGLLKDATPGDLIYLTVHEMTHAFQHRMVSFPIPPSGALGELTDFWRGNTPQSHGYIAYTGAENFERYAEQPLEFAAFLAGNYVEYQTTGGNSRLWGTDETEARDLYA